MVRCHVLTGGPGAGKTTLIRALQERGVSCMPEAGRAVIRVETAAGGAALPWHDRIAFARKMLAADEANFLSAGAAGGSWVFDRAIPDVLGYVRLCGLQAWPQLLEAARLCRYAEPIFVAPPWRSIYEQDEERKQDFTEAQATYFAMIETYHSLGYATVELPCTSVAARVEFILDHVLPGKR